MTELAAHRDPRYLRVPANSCLRVVDGNRWVASAVVGVGEYHVAIRASSPEVHDALSSALRGHLVEDPQAPASYGVYQTRSSLTTARSLYRVYHGCGHVFTTPSLDRAVAIVAGYLERLLPREDRSDDVLELSALGIIGSKGAVLVPWSLPYKLPRLEQRLSQFGLRQLEGASVIVDPTTAELIVPRPRLLDARWLSDGGSSQETECSVTPPGSHRVIGWVFSGHLQDTASFSRAHAVAHGMKLIYGRISATAKLQRMVALVNGLEVSAAVGPDDVVAFAKDHLARTGDSP